MYRDHSGAIHREAQLFAPAPRFGLEDATAYTHRGPHPRDEFDSTTEA